MFPNTVSGEVNSEVSIPWNTMSSLQRIRYLFNEMESCPHPKQKLKINLGMELEKGDILRVKEFCAKHNLWLIEDNCDALGSTYTIDGVTKYTGTWGDIGTSSFYPPHHMTMGEGGCVYTDSALLSKLILS